MQAIEDSDLNDADIIASTVIARQEHSGRFQFRTTLPDGSPFESEWIQESDKGKAAPLWAEAVRSRIVSLSEEKVAIARRELKERRRTAAPSLVSPDGSPLNTSSVTAAVPALVNSAPLPAIRTPAIQPIQADADPTAYVRTQYLQAKSMAEFHRTEMEREREAFQKFKAQESKWLGLLQAMGESVGLNPSNNAVITAGETVEQPQRVIGEQRRAAVGSVDGPFSAPIVSTDQSDALTDQDDDFADCASC